MTQPTVSKHWRNNQSICKVVTYFSWADVRLPWRWRLSTREIQNDEMLTGRNGSVPSWFITKLVAINCIGELSLIRQTSADFVANQKVTLSHLACFHSIFLFWFGGIKFCLCTECAYEFYETEWKFCFNIEWILDCKIVSMNLRTLWRYINLFLTFNINIFPYF